MAVESAPFAPSAHLPTMAGGARADRDRVALLAAQSQFLLAIAAAALVQVYLWRTRAVIGCAPWARTWAPRSMPASVPRNQILIAMGISGALAGMVAMNEIAGVNRRLLLDFVGGAGFTASRSRSWDATTRSASCSRACSSARSSRAGPR
jgi:simple sugar transport system permease protein